MSQLDNKPRKATTKTFGFSFPISLVPLTFNINHPVNKIIIRKYGNLTADVVDGPRGVYFYSDLMLNNDPLTVMYPNLLNTVVTFWTYNYSSNDTLTYTYDKPISICNSILTIKNDLGQTPDLTGALFLEFTFLLV